MKRYYLNTISVVACILFGLILMSRCGPSKNDKRRYFEERKTITNEQAVSYALDSSSLVTQFILNNECQELLAKYDSYKDLTLPALASLSICNSQQGKYDKAINILPDSITKFYKPYDGSMPLENDPLVNFSLWYNTFLRGTLGTFHDRYLIGRISDDKKALRNPAFLFIQELQSKIHWLENFEYGNTNGHSEDSLHSAGNWQFIKILDIQMTYLEDLDYKKFLTSLDSLSDELAEYKLRVKVKYFNSEIHDQLLFEKFILDRNATFPKTCFLDFLNTGYYFDLDIESECRKCIDSKDKIERLLGNAWLALYYVDNKNIIETQKIIDIIGYERFPIHASRYQRVYNGLLLYILLKKSFLAGDYPSMKVMLESISKNPVIDKKASEFGDEQLALLSEIYYTFFEDEGGYKKYIAFFGY